MSNTNDGGPAYPSEGEGHGNPKYHSPGMSLRDWFAGQALVAMGTWSPIGIDDWNHREVAQKMRSEYAYEQADAMLEARAVLSSAGGVWE